MAAAVAAVLAAGVFAVGGAPSAGADVGDIATYGDPGGAASTHAPAGITAGPDGNLWYTSIGSNRIGRITPSGEITTFADPEGPDSTSGPSGITTGPDGNLWFTSSNNHRIGRLDPDTGDITTFADPAGIESTNGPRTITAGPDGNLWYTSVWSDRIGRITPSGEITTFADPAGHASTWGPYGITAGPDGNLWFTSSENDRIGRLDPDTGDITTFADPAGIGSTHRPRAITVGPDGNLWYTNLWTDRIGRIDPDTGAISTFPSGVAGSEPDPITVGADGNLWYGNTLTSTIGRMDPDDQSVTTFTDPGGLTSTTFPYGITAGPDGNIWYTSVAVDRIGTVEVCSPSAFTDVGPTHPFLEDICFMAGQGISTGFQPGPTFKPSAAVSRQAMSAFMYRLAGEPDFVAPGDATFADVSTANGFFAEIEWMASEGITTGYPGVPRPTYQPTAAVSRQAMSAFMYRLAGEPDFVAPGDATFADVSTANGFFAEIEWMASEGITTGFAGSPKPSYKPAAAVSRQAMSAFMSRLNPLVADFG